MLGRLTTPGGVSYKTPRLHRKSNLTYMPVNLLSLSIKNRNNQNTKNNSSNSNSERSTATSVVRMVESHRTQRYLHYISERSLYYRCNCCVNCHLLFQDQITQDKPYSC